MAGNICKRWITRERDGGTILPTVWGRIAQLDLAGSRTRSNDYFFNLSTPLLGLRELAVEGLHVQAQRPLVDVLLLRVRVLQLHAPVVLQQPVV